MKRSVFEDITEIDLSANLTGCETDGWSSVCLQFFLELKFDWEAEFCDEPHKRAISALEQLRKHEPFDAKKRYRIIVEEYETEQDA